jgi:hypothetical protein
MMPLTPSFSLSSFSSLPSSMSKKSRVSERPGIRWVPGKGWVRGTGLWAIAKRTELDQERGRLGRGPRQQGGVDLHAAIGTRICRQVREEEPCRPCRRREGVELGVHLGDEPGDHGGRTLSVYSVGEEFNQFLVAMAGIVTRSIARTYPRGTTGPMATCVRTWFDWRNAAGSCFLSYHAVFPRGIRLDCPAIL